jgi:hypothetical protein
MKERTEIGPVVIAVSDPRGLPAIPGINLSDNAITDAGLLVHLEHSIRYQGVKVQHLPAWWSVSCR